MYSQLACTAPTCPSSCRFDYQGYLWRDLKLIQVQWKDVNPTYAFGVDGVCGEGVVLKLGSRKLGLQVRAAGSIVLETRLNRHMRALLFATYAVKLRLSRGVRGQLNPLT